MKKIFAAIAVFSFSALAFASGDMFVAKPTNYFDGFYAGIGGGVSHTTADASVNGASQLTRTYEPALSSKALQEVAESDFNSSLNADLGDIMAAGEVFAGFGKSFNLKSNRNNFYLGLELFGKYTPTEMDASSSNNQVRVTESRADVLLVESLSAKLENDYSFGGDIRFGYLISPRTMVYILAGLDVAEFKYKAGYDASLPQAYINPDQTYGDLSTSTSSSDNSWMFGFMPGVGIETMLTDRLSLRAQYVYTFWGDGDFGVNGSASDSYTRTESTTTTTFNSQSNGNAENIQRGLFTIDLTYHFNGI